MCQTYLIQKTFFNIFYFYELCRKILTQKQIIVLRAVRWRFKLRIDVDPEAPLGQRAKLAGKTKQEKPRIQSGANVIPVSYC